MNKYITKEQLNKKLCIDCKHVSVREGLWGKNEISCGFYRSKVDDSPLYSASHSRYKVFLCGDRKWELDLERKIVENNNEKLKLEYEDGVSTYMKQARNLVEMGITPQFSNGFLDEAIKRVKASQQ